MAGIQGGGYGEQGGYHTTRKGGQSTSETSDFDVEVGTDPGLTREVGCVM